MLLLIGDTIGQTITEKIISNSTGRYVHAGDTIDYLPVDTKFVNDPAVPQVISDFEKEFKTILGELYERPEIHKKEKTFVILDHLSPSTSPEIANLFNRIKQFGRQYEIKVYKECEGIEHVLLAEDGKILPGEIVIATDSHACTHGAIGAFAFGVGVKDMVCALATGHIYNFTVPETVKIDLKGRLRKGVYAKDIILYVLGQMGESGCSEKVAEFTGNVINKLSMDGRFTIANMAVEMAARTGIMNPDQKTIEYLESRTSDPYKISRSDKNATYTEKRLFNVNQIEPQVAEPYSPANSKSISELEGVKINKAFIGSCTNSRKDDLRSAAEILKGKKVNDDVELTVIPGTKNILKWAEENGILQIYIEAGANIYPSSCGLCFGNNLGVLGAEDVCISSINRNYLGRAGDPKSKMYLASPATVAASAVYGEITDPRKVTE